ncbi:hypothetical protein A3C09_01240 [Candidatus Uhrbacteria bacterium RIFCSPHIGHO2_02_FULL_47_44]|nr:MAG: hypothetical protein A3C09_01240 [Candidatus Uhrbacteria bacterium RIFCSPHIGHO2_02_FULL_47_44]
MIVHRRTKGDYLKIGDLLVLREKDASSYVNTPSAAFSLQHFASHPIFEIVTQKYAKITEFG